MSPKTFNVLFFFGIGLFFFLWAIKVAEKPVIKHILDDIGFIFLSLIFIAMGILLFFS